MQQMFPYINCSTCIGTDNICALGFTEGAKAPIDVFGSNSEMISGARLKLGQCTGHRQRKGFHLTNLLPVLLRCVVVRVVLMKGIEVIAVYRCTCPIGFWHTPRQHYTGWARHQLELRLLRRWGSLGLWGQAGNHGRCRERGQYNAGTPRWQCRGYRAGFHCGLL